MLAKRQALASRPPVAALALSASNDLVRTNPPPTFAARLLRLCFAVAMAMPWAAKGQIYSGTTPEGTVVLSDRPSEATPHELVAAPSLSVVTGALPAGPAEAATATPKRPAGPRPPTLPSHLIDLIQTAARAHGVPAPLIAAVAAAESGFNLSARSPKGAGGLMQLMPQTARRFNVNNRFSASQSLGGGAAYLRWLGARFENDLTLVLAAYNAGEHAVARAEGVPSFAETQAYIPKVMAYLRHYETLPELASSAQPAVHAVGTVPPPD